MIIKEIRKEPNGFLLLVNSRDKERFVIIWDDNPTEDYSTLNAALNKFEILLEQEPQ